jgi:hypothetical protein
MSLRALLREICAGVEIYFTGRSDGDYFKTAFVLCDDYTELTSKLWLLRDNPKWRDTHDREAKKLEDARKKVVAMARGAGTATPEEIALVEGGGRIDRFKAYDEVLNDLRQVIEKKRAKDIPSIDKYHRAMKERRKQRNRFFHSADFLSMDVNRQECIEAFCDLLDYGRLLFGPDWDDELRGARNLQTMEILLRLDKKTAANPALSQKIKSVFQTWPINGKARSKGTLIAEYPDDLHVRLCVIHGDSELKNRLQTLLDSTP